MLRSVASEPVPCGSKAVTDLRRLARNAETEYADAHRSVPLPRNRGPYKATRRKDKVKFRAPYVRFCKNSIAQLSAKEKAHLRHTRRAPARTHWRANEHARGCGLGGGLAGRACPRPATAGVDACSYRRGFAASDSQMSPTTAVDGVTPLRRIGRDASGQLLLTHGNTATERQLRLLNGVDLGIHGRRRRQSRRQVSQYPTKGTADVQTITQTAAGCSSPRDVKRTLAGAASAPALAILSSSRLCSRGTT